MFDKNRVLLSYVKVAVLDAMKKYETEEGEGVTYSDISEALRMVLVAFAKEVPLNVNR